MHNENFKGLYKLWKKLTYKFLKDKDTLKI